MNSNSKYKNDNLGNNSEVFKIPENLSKEKSEEKSIHDDDYDPCASSSKISTLSKLKNLSGSKIKDWRNLVSDRLRTKIAKYSQQRMDYIRGYNNNFYANLSRIDNSFNDIEIDNHSYMNSFMTNDVNMITPEQVYYDKFVSSEEDLLLSEYFDRWQDLCENEDINSDEYEYELFKDRNISICPKCYFPVMHTKSRILCLNTCFEFITPENFINDNFTVDNFVDLYTRILRYHGECRSPVQVLVFEDDVSLACSKCLNEDLNEI
jgi:hypothetical protein